VERGTGTVPSHLGAAPMQFDEFHCSLTLDPKGRLTLPAGLRQELSKAKVNQLVIVANQGKRGGLSFYTVEDYRSIVKGRVRNEDPFANRTIVYLRAVDSTSQTATIDSNGRVLIPPLLRKLAGLERDLVVFSSLDWFEVWDAGRWESAFESAMSLWDEATGNPPAETAPGSGEGR